MQMYLHTILYKNVSLFDPSNNPCHIQIDQSTIYRLFIFKSHTVGNLFITRKPIEHNRIAIMVWNRAFNRLQSLRKSK